MWVWREFTIRPSALNSSLRGAGGDLGAALCGGSRLNLCIETFHSSHMWILHRAVKLTTGKKSPPRDPPHRYYSIIDNDGLIPQRSRACAAESRGKSHHTTRDCVGCEYYRVVTVCVCVCFLCVREGEKVQEVSESFCYSVFSNASIPVHVFALFQIRSHCTCNYDLFYNVIVLC